jgi:hypothetical protein
VLKLGRFIIGGDAVLLIGWGTCAPGKNVGARPVGGAGAMLNAGDVGLSGVVMDWAGVYFFLFLFCLKAAALKS